MKQGNGTQGRKLNSAVIGVVFIIAGIVALGVQFAPLFADVAEPEPINYHNACSDDPEPFDSYDDYMPHLVRLGVPEHKLVEVKHEVRSAIHDVHSAVAEVRQSVLEARTEVHQSLLEVRQEIRNSLRAIPASLAGIFRDLNDTPERKIEVKVKVRKARHQRTMENKQHRSESL
jgi:hypothetical protein